MSVREHKHCDHCDKDITDEPYETKVGEEDICLNCSNLRRDSDAKSYERLKNEFDQTVINQHDIISIMGNIDRESTLKMIGNAGLEMVDKVLNHKE